MQIQEMFKNDINREINPVVKVETEILRQELDEYVITKELKSIFVDFFNYYAKTFSEDVQNIGVWISGGFGSGKSHFLKILSYLLENKKIDEIRTVERFRSKFEDPGTFMQIEQAIKGETETILFNINKYKSEKKTALTLAFAKIFYKHCGYFGDIKISKLEQSIDELGKMGEFQRIFKEKSGKNWIDSRSKAFLTFSKHMEETLQEIFGTDRNVIRDWKKEADIFDIDTLVHDIKKYVDKRSPNYRLLFMADEVGQYVGADSDRLLDLQTLVEEIGTQCRGKVWIICTGQEALDKVIKTRQDEFSKIQDRFIKLPLNSTSIDEVIQKRLLDKNSEANESLNELYEKNELTIKNLLKFNKDDAVSDIRGFNNAIDFSKNFPFIPYQFILMQKVLKKITEHGSSGRNTSTGERSILSAFHKVAQKIEKNNEYALAPFYPFYDTIHNILDETIRQVINRCENAAENDSEIKPQDVNVLKLLYLIRYLDDDVKATVDSIVILMADDIRTDKISLRNQVEASLGRLLKQNYIGRTGNTYHFLTNEEQDIAKDIKNTSVNMQKLSEEIRKTIFGEIFTDKKFRYKDRSRFQDFQISKFIDEIQLESIAGGMELHIYSVATNESSKEELRLLTDSNKKAIVVLDNDNTTKII